MVLNAEWESGFKDYSRGPCTDYLKDPLLQSSLRGLLRNTKDRSPFPTLPAERCQGGYLMFLLVDSRP